MRLLKDFLRKMIVELDELREADSIVATATAHAS